ncbi:ferritin-like domain-containing protein [Flavobacterium sp. 1355]|uniref:YciE/YciF ferroxidase family protein n=1 Tax=Flavobacterium sp. 1355 TaxID=2806571 RepID=UPI001AE40692|nr:DUF892 family protein [Flavobacterium sp. 1355]MBP1225666.1 ferritin-like metal-binding protein YciE [Flavobacterium sp. 1355]
MNGVSTTNQSAHNYGLRRLFINQLREMIWAERALTKTIPKIVDNIASPNLIAIMKDHALITSQQIERLERGFELIGVSTRGKKCVVLEALIKECKDTLKYTQHGPLRDAAIIAVVQKIEHYAMAAYGTLTFFGKALGENALADALNKTLIEEKEADAFLSEAAYRTINFDAAFDEKKFLASHYYRGETPKF